MRTSTSRAFCQSTRADLRQIRSRSRQEPRSARPSSRVWHSYRQISTSFANARQMLPRRAQPLRRRTPERDAHHVAQLSVFGPSRRGQAAARAAQFDFVEHGRPPILNRPARATPRIAAERSSASRGTGAAAITAGDGDALTRCPQPDGDRSNSNRPRKQPKLSGIYQVQSVNHHSCCISADFAFHS
jgi:hypothetical protein